MLEIKIFVIGFVSCWLIIGIIYFIFLSRLKLKQPQQRLLDAYLYAIRMVPFLVLPILILPILRAISTRGITEKEYIEAIKKMY